MDRQVEFYFKGWIVLYFFHHNVDCRPSNIYNIYASILEIQGDVKNELS
jgi:hypothetical protein